MSLGLYVHLPFCRVHCAYCPFAVSTDLSLQDAYVAALIAEIGRRAGGEAVDTLFFGGGTPSRTEPAHLQRIVEALRAGYRIEPEAEFSIEANPEDVTPDTIEFWRSLGVDRLSIGVQSFNDVELQPIGRIHSAARGRGAIRDAVASGLRTSIDLILGLPQQTRESFRASLEEAIASGIGHISIYMLDLDEDTALRRRVVSGVMNVPDDDEIAELYIEMVGTMRRAGFAQYEISNFAKPGEESRHNLRYWRRREYHGFGLGAHSFIGDKRFANTRDIRKYIDGNVYDFVEQLSDVERRHELVFLGLRQASGIASDDLLQLCGEEAVGWIEQGVSEGWLRRDGSRVAFTPAGFVVSSELISQLF